MDTTPKAGLELEIRLSRRLVDVYIRVGMIVALAALCYWIFSPFLALMAWALILAVTLYPAHQALARRIGGRQGLAATVLVLGGIVLIVVPTTMLTATRAIFDRIVGTGRGEEFARLSTATIRAVAQGVLGVALIQAIAVGLLMMIAGIPFAGVFAVIVLVLGIAQLPAAVVTLPVIVYIWTQGDYATAAAVTYTVLLVLAGMLDNVLKPLMLGRGVDAPMPVILLGALGGMASAGILGMFVGATLLALGYQIFMGWVAANPDTEAAAPALPVAD